MRRSSHVGLLIVIGWIAHPLGLLRPGLPDTAEGLVIADIPERGGPTDGSVLDGAIMKARRSGMQLRSVYGDRGWHHHRRRHAQQK